MAEEKKKKKTDIEAESAAGPTAEELAAELEALKAENENLIAELEATKKIADEAKDTLLRTAAEYDNFRKRSAKEKDGVYAESVATTISAFLPVVDNLERAVAFSDGDGLKQGLELTLKQLADVLAKLKITPEDPTGKEFDPNLHNAVIHCEDETLGENTVAEVLQKGYLLDGRVIRYAMVKVAN
jgi:molecular chaperone GrpE